MARRVDRLTDRSVKAARGKGLRPDGDGLYLQVTATGAKSWVFRFKLNGRAARDMGLGPYPATSLSEARQKARNARQHRDAGRDPIAARDAVAAQQRLAAARGTTFAEVAEQLIASNEAGWRNAKHRQQWRNTLTAYVYPLMGDVAVADVDTPLVLRVLEPVWHEKPETAARVRGRIERVLASAKARGLRSGENPAAWRGHLSEILPARSKVARVVHHAALDYRRVPGFMAELRAKEGITARALEFTILTATRTSEAIGARFDEIDLAAKVWCIPGERMKAGQEHRVPLCDRAVAIAQEMDATRLNEFVFPGMKRGQPLSDTAMLMLLRDMHAGITVHGFRSSFRDWCGETTSFPHDVAEAALAHTRKDKAHAAYQRGDLIGKRRELMEAWARYCGPAKALKRTSPPPRKPEKPRKKAVRARGKIKLPTRTPAPLAR